MKEHNNSFRAIFRNPRVFLPVIHPVSPVTALRSIETAVLSGADGIFLINQGMTSGQVLDFIPEVNNRYPDLWIGVNLLGIEPEDVIELIAKLPVGGIWSDNAGINENTEAQTAAECFREARQRNRWNGLYFGGVAFKYQRQVPDARIPDAARRAKAWMDVITSSGPGTSFAAPLDKVMALRLGAGDHPVALASGVSPENIEGFLPFVDAYLVASEIETSNGSGVLVPERTKLLATKIHGWQPDGPPVDDRHAHDAHLNHPPAASTGNQNPQNRS